MLGDCVLIVGISCLTALLGEFFTWFFVYRTESYQKLKLDVERQTKKIEKKKEMSESVKSGKKKRLEKDEEKLKNDSRDLSMVKMKSMMATGFVFTSLLGVFNSMFEGRVVAKLPFQPISFIRGLSHRGLLGEDFTDSSFIFYYILCTMSIRTNLQKYLGFAPSRAASKQNPGFFNVPQPKQ